VKVKIVKNKVAAPFRTAEFDIIFNEGISYTGDILNLGEKYGIIKKAGASYSYEGTSLGRGYDSAKTFLVENPKVTKELETKIKEAAKQAAQ
jgi:recombination protein RecA